MSGWLFKLSTTRRRIGVEAGLLKPFVARGPKYRMISEIGLSIDLSAWATRELFISLAESRSRALSPNTAMAIPPSREFDISHFGMGSRPWLQLPPQKRPAFTCPELELAMPGELG